jgi:hypothetical protein
MRTAAAGQGARAGAARPRRRGLPEGALVLCPVVLVGAGCTHPGRRGERAAMPTVSVAVGHGCGTVVVRPRGGIGHDSAPAPTDAVEEMAGERHGVVLRTRPACTSWSPRSNAAAHGAAGRRGQASGATGSAAGSGGLERVLHHPRLNRSPGDRQTPGRPYGEDARGGAARGIACAGLRRGEATAGRRGRPGGRIP